MVECNISFNYLNEYNNLCEEFFSLLSQQHTGVSLDILEEMILMSNIEIENMDLSNNDIIVVTPTTSYILTPTMETSNRVIRYFRDKKNHFLRVQFVDKVLSKVGSSNDDTSNHLGQLDNKTEYERYNDALECIKSNCADSTTTITSTAINLPTFGDIKKRQNFCAFLLGVLDVTEILQEDQIYY
ncbi:14601_t:CDS:2 [Rhizophagus irregularis]|nr:14601_t:CDS:2 [Rhizophagus irregularis]